MALSFFGRKPGKASSFRLRKIRPRLELLEARLLLDTNPIVEENKLPGTPQSQWDILQAGDPSIQGFATDISVNHGDTVYFKINTPSLHYRLDVYRMGYYGGMGARQVATIDVNLPQAQTQPDPTIDAATGLMDYGTWSVSASWAVPATAVSGIYFAKLVREDGVDGTSHVFFVVRDDGGKSDLLYQTSDATWQAYNQYGGNSLYEGNGSVGRAYKVSYNRPFDDRSQPTGFGAFNWVFDAEYPMVRWLEANGYYVSYFTDVDSDRRGSELLNHKVFLSSGHDEYWSGGQRANVEAARNAGVNLAFFTGNESFWKTRWETSIDGSGTPYRTLVCYKESSANDKIDPLKDTWTGNWRDPRFSPPADGGRPENALSGNLFVVNDDSRPITVPSTYANLRFWRNTAVANLLPGQTATLANDTLGYEWDEDLDNGARPAGLFDLSSTTANADLLWKYGDTYSPGQATHSLTMYRAASGALVFAAGTIRWSWGLDGHHDGIPSTPDSSMQQATVNLFADMGVQPGSLQPGLVAATASTDTIAPTSTIASPLPGSLLGNGTSVTISGTARDSGGGVVAAVEVSTDGGVTWHPALGRNNWTFTWTPNGTGLTSIRSRAVDDSGNLETPVGEVKVSLNGPLTLWNSQPVPADVAVNDPNSIELGMKFRTDVAGWVFGVRFYKGPANTGTHQANLWTSTGDLLATATFSSESASGWQQVYFSKPVAINANTTYVVSYHTSAGTYSVDSGFFTSTITNGPLHGLQDGLDGGNGVYNYSASSVFPNLSFESSNYWVDVAFATAAVALTAPVPGTVLKGTVTVSANAVSPVGIRSVQFQLDGVNLGTAVPIAPYSLAWDTTKVADGAHTILAIATDVNGNTLSSASIAVQVNNALAPANLILDGSKTFQKIDGFGANLNATAWNDGKVIPALDTLLTVQGDNLFRVIIETVSGWEDTFNPDPYTNNAVYATPKFTNLWKEIAYLNSKNVPVMLNVMGYLPSWFGPNDTITTSNEDAWADMIASMVYYGVNVAKVKIDYLSPMNEQDVGNPEGPSVDQFQYVTLMDKLLAKLAAHGLGNIPLVGPDLANVDNLTSKYLPQVFGDPTLTRALKHVTFHDYFGKDGSVDSAIQNSGVAGLDWWVTEYAGGLYFDADQGVPIPDEWGFSEKTFQYLVQHLQNGASGATVYDGVDAFYQHHGAVNSWGQVAWDQTTNSYSIRKRLYANGQVFQFVKPGEVRVASSTTVPGLVQVAFTDPVTGRVTITGENTQDSEVVLSGSLTGGLSASSFQAYFTNATVGMDLKKQADVAVTKGTFTLTVPAHTIFTLNGLRTAPPKVATPVNFSLTEDGTLWQHDLAFDPAQPPDAAEAHWRRLSSGSFSSVSAVTDPNTGQSVVFAIVRSDHSLWVHDLTLDPTLPADALDAHWRQLSSGAFSSVSAAYDSSGANPGPVVFALLQGGSLWEHDLNFDPSAPAAALNAHWRLLSTGLFDSISAASDFKGSSAGAPAVFAILQGSGQLWEHDLNFDPGLPASTLNAHWRLLSSAAFDSISAASNTEGANLGAVVFGILKGDHSLWQHDLVFDPTLAADALNAHWRRLSSGAFASVSATIDQGSGNPVVFAILQGARSLWVHDLTFDADISAGVLDAHWRELSTAGFASVSASYEHSPTYSGPVVSGTLLDEELWLHDLTFDPTLPPDALNAHWRRLTSRAIIANSMA
jgi:O-glycosyl hydrolase